MYHLSTKPQFASATSNFATVISAVHATVTSATVHTTVASAIIHTTVPSATVHTTVSSAQITIGVYPTFATNTSATIYHY